METRFIEYFKDIQIPQGHNLCMEKSMHGMTIVLALGGGQ